MHIAAYTTTNADPASFQLQEISRWLPLILSRIAKAKYIKPQIHSRPLSTNNQQSTTNNPLRDTVQSKA